MDTAYNTSDNLKLLQQLRVETAFPGVAPAPALPLVPHLALAQDQTLVLDLTLSLFLT